VPTELVRPRDDSLAALVVPKGGRLVRRVLFWFVLTAVAVGVGMGAALLISTFLEL
jgi:hypothetical protein